MISILLDTSYLITLADPGRAHHETAKRYLREALAQGFPLYLSAVVASEFQVDNLLAISLCAIFMYCLSILTTL